MSFWDSQLFGVIVGAVISTGFSWFLDWRKSISEDKKYIKQKREETYCMILRTYFELNKSRLFPSYKTDLDKLIADLYPYVNLYATQNIKDIYNEIAHKTGNNEEILIAAIREELGIKD